MAMLGQVALPHFGVRLQVPIRRTPLTHGRYDNLHEQTSGTWHS